MEKKYVLTPKVVNQTVLLFEANVVETNNKTVIELGVIEVDVCIGSFRAERELNLTKE
jgi:hypothetical protein